MDIHVGAAASATAQERAAVEAVLGAPAAHDPHLLEGGRESRSRRDLLLPVLHALNDRVGWISRGALDYVCERLVVPPADAFGVASFYHMFSLAPRPETVIYACDDIACMCEGAGRLRESLDDPLGPVASLAARGDVAIVHSPCLGLCDVGPAALVVKHGPERRAVPLAHATAASIGEACARPSVQRWTQARASLGEARLLRRSAAASNGSTARHHEPAALTRALSLGPERVVREVVASKLMGRGGAAFPTGRKWEAVAREPDRPHYLVCNADESEPGTFKDLALLLDQPSSILEAMAIAGFAGGCSRGYLYIRGEYPAAAESMRAAIAAARDAGWLGTGILGSGFAFDIEIRRGAGAYICGEETALFNSVEGQRGEPRNKPPFPVQRGLFGKPTIVNNVETLANIPGIILEGGEAYAKIGTPESTGTKLFCLSGNVGQPGLYEVPFGATLRELIEMAGGVRGGKRLQAVLLGGAAGTFLTPDELDVPLSFEGARSIKASLGSGVVMLFDETVDLRAVVARIARFFREESCGQCVPCRVGTVRQEEALARLAAGGAQATECALLAQIGAVMRDASICGLGQTASSAVESALAKFDLYGKGRA